MTAVKGFMVQNVSSLHCPVKISMCWFRKSKVYFYIIEGNTIQCIKFINHVQVAEPICSLCMIVGLAPRVRLWCWGLPLLRIGEG